MDKDFIKVSKGAGGNDFTLEIYFSKVNSTIKVDLKGSDFLNLLVQCGKLYNENTTSFKLEFSESEFNRLIAKKRDAELQKLSNELKQAQDKPEVDVIIFISDEYIRLSDTENITNSCGDFMEALGFELETEDEPVFGSFFKRLKFIFSSTIGEEDLVQLYQRGKKALELKHIELPSAEQTEKLANAAEKLVKSLEGVEEGVIRCGGLIVLKKGVDGKPKLIIQQLSTEMIIILDKHPQLLFNVNTVYELLTGDVRKNIDDSGSHSALIA